MTSTAGVRAKGVDKDGPESENETDELDLQSGPDLQNEQEDAEEVEEPYPMSSPNGFEDDPLLQTNEEDDETYNSLYSELEKAQGGVTPFSEASDLPPELEAARVENPNGPSSTPDDTPSVQGSRQSSPSASELPSRTSTPSNFSPSPQPFERRFQARRTSSQVNTSRTGSPAFLSTHSRQQSASSQISYNSQSDADDELEQKPWEVVRWTRLKKITAQAFSEAGKRTFGRPVYLTVGAFIAIGTSKGIILLFDYQQTLKSIIGQGTAAAECGSITALAISADHSTMAGGHADGSVFTWEIARPANPFLQIHPIDKKLLGGRKNDGHVRGCAVLHVGFLGTRHTALVSADDSGMAFSHLATRGLGALGRSVRTTRILGRYPEISTSPANPRKPSSVLAFAPLPLGNVQRATDELGLTALLTPYLLVVVSTTPIAQTQYKTPRANQVAAHSAMTGCLAWFPSVKLKDSAYATKQRMSATKLVYCWSNTLHILEVQETAETTDPDDNRRQTLSFRHKGNWKGDEAIVAVQWLSRSILVVLTITQRLIILEDKNLRISDSSDLNSKHIYHEDLFSHQLQPLVDKMEQDDPTMHGVVPNAYHMSFKAYKSRLFLLGTGDVSMGLMSNWADRLVALMGTGSYISAINLATSYYEGSFDNVTIGLPEDNSTRHDMVQEKILDMISASLKYIFNEDQNVETDRDVRSQLNELIGPVFYACCTMETLNFLFDEVYEWYSDASSQDIFLYTLEPHVIDGRVSSVPPTLLKDMMNWYGAHGLGARLEEMILSLRTETMDIDQVITLCKTYSLYDAMIYVYNQALDDYLSPLIELLSTVKNLYAVGQQVMPSYEQSEAASKIYPYLAYALTGRKYPDGAEIIAPYDDRAKAFLYGFMFSARPVVWPEPRGTLFRSRNDGNPEPAYPYLHLLLHYDAPSYLSMLNEAFEDAFLNEKHDRQLNGDATDSTSIQAAGVTMTRQNIITALMQVMHNNDFSQTEQTYLDIFIARNLPKFPQFLRLSGPTLRTILLDLCNYPEDDLANECQLSVEYLLSVYHPSDLLSFTGSFEKAGFFRILRSIYRGDKLYAKWIEAHLQDPDNGDAVFRSINDCLRPSSGLSKRQIQDVKLVLLKHVKDLENIDISKTALCLVQVAPDLLDKIFDMLHETKSQYLFLQAIFEPPERSLPLNEVFGSANIDRYVQLMCRFAPQHVAEYVHLLSAGDLKLDTILPVMEDNGAIDAAIVLMAKDGLRRDAMDRLTKYLGTLQTALVGLLSGDSRIQDTPNIEETSDALSETIEKYTKLGIWLCQSQPSISDATTTLKRQKHYPLEITEMDLTVVEALWLDLIDTVVMVSRDVTAAARSSQQDEPGDMDRNTLPGPAANLDSITDRLRSVVQQTFTALLSSTTSVATSSSSTSKLSQPRPLVNSKSHLNSSLPEFLPILRLFLARAAQHSPTLSDLRSVLSNLFATYTFEESILALANEFIDKDVFSQVEEADRQRRAGWRPRSQVCEGCRKRAWGAGAGGGLWEQWRAKKVKQALQREREKRGMVHNASSSPVGEHGVHGKGKGKVTPVEEAFAETDVEEADSLTDGNGVERPKPDSVVIFSCMHLWHRKCLEQAGGASTAFERGPYAPSGEHFRFECPLCT